MRFVALLSTDAALRDAAVEYLAARISEENSLDRVDSTYSLDFQRGRIAELRRLIEMIRALDRRKGEDHGTVRKD